MHFNEIIRSEVLLKQFKTSSTETKLVRKFFQICQSIHSPMRNLQMSFKDTRPSFPPITYIQSPWRQEQWRLRDLGNGFPGNGLTGFHLNASDMPEDLFCIILPFFFYWNLSEHLKGPINTWMFTQWTNVNVSHSIHTG